MGVYLEGGRGRTDEKSGMRKGERRRRRGGRAKGRRKNRERVGRGGVRNPVRPASYQHIFTLMHHTPAASPSFLCNRSRNDIQIWLLSRRKCIFV